MFSGSFSESSYSESSGTQLSISERHIFPDYKISFVKLILELFFSSCGGVHKAMAIGAYEYTAKTSRVHEDRSAVVSYTAGFEGLCISDPPNYFLTSSLSLPHNQTAHSF